MTAVIPLPLFEASDSKHRSAGERSAALLARLGRPVTYHLTTLGCPKNDVDSDHFERRLRAAGCVAVTEPQRADVLVVNTCGFIEQSQQESIDTLLALGRECRRRQRLVAAGCLVTLNRADLAAELPEVSAFFDPTEWDGTTTAVTGFGLLPSCTVAQLDQAELALNGGAAPTVALALTHEPWLLRDLAAGVRDRGKRPRAGDGLLHDIPHAGPATARVSAYLKISDGCNAPCTFCIIPQIKGQLASTPLPDLLAEAQRLRNEGVRELVLVAQDSTAYGEDVGSRDALADLLRELSAAVPGVWLRLMYAYPGRVTPRLIAAMAELPNVVHYLDVPLQHGSVSTLRRMRRPANLAMVRAMISDLRAAMPDIALRTSFITGFPGETDAEFHELVDFVEEIQFDHVGVFTYSQQQRAVSGAFEGQVPERVKRSRRAAVMARQQEISLAKHQALVGSEMTVLIERAHRTTKSGAVVWAGRAQRFAPDVDGIVRCRGEAAPGQFVQVAITKALPYDLVGEILEPTANGRSAGR